MEQYEIIRAGLAADELASAKNGATNLVVAVQEELGGAKALLDPSQKIAACESLDDARAAFQLISIEVAKLVEGQPGFFVMTCPMLKGSVWVQTTRTVGNPYKGKAMLECGEIKR
jgi:Cu(I)/Ag(I) efflux system membrane fusion protein